ncbi:hypothetical protein RDABS01_025923, partial [Bienertia sinuspersici]
ISQWMSDKRYMLLSVADVAIRLDLIAKVHGIEQAENYFNNTPKQMRTMEVYGALLNCYSQVKCVDKADAVMQKMRELGYAKSAINYNVLLNLYSQTKNYKKLDALIQEMEVKRIKFDRYSYSILLNASGGDTDIDKIEQIQKRIESDSQVDIDWMLYAALANQFIKAGSVKKALELLRKVESLVVYSKKKNEAFSYLLTLYATAGKKEQVLRVWNKCKKFKVCNRDYICMLPSLLKFDDIETAENIFEEWKASELNKDFRIPNILVGYYCKKGLLDKAEALIESGKRESWEKPNAWTWYWMSVGYVKGNKILKAVEAMENALFEHIPRVHWKPDKETMVACLKYLKDEGDVHRSSNFVRLLQEKEIISEEIKHKLLAYFSGKCSYEDGLVQNWSKCRDEDYDDHGTQTCGFFKWADGSDDVRELQELLFEKDTI